MTERFNRMLLEMLGTLEPEKKNNWKAHVRPLVHAYNCTRHNSTNQSPYFLMFGRQPKLPIDLAFGLITEKDRKPHTKYIQEIRERLVQAYKLASEASIKAQTKQKEGYDLRTRGAIIESWDRVLVRIVAFDSKHKISDRWENDTYNFTTTYYYQLVISLKLQRKKTSSLSQNQEHDFRRNKENIHLGHQMKVVVVVVKKIIH